VQFRYMSSGEVKITHASFLGRYMHQFLVSVTTILTQNRELTRVSLYGDKKSFTLFVRLR
jgi:hypothetical protein